VQDHLDQVVGYGAVQIAVSESDGRLPNRAGPPTSWQTAQAPWYSRAPIDEAGMARRSRYAFQFCRESLLCRLVDSHFVEGGEISAIARMSSSGKAESSFNTGAIGPAATP